MIKKLLRPFLIILLVGFSFFYTDKSVDLIRESDPLMKQIKNTNYKYQQEPKNAKIEGDTIVPGITGKEIDYDETYTRMKNYGTYNEALTTLKEIKPDLSIDDIYDKFIISGNEEKKSISLVFKVEETTNINQIVNLLNKENIKATFFIDGIYLEKNYNNLHSLLSHELEILSYNNTYDPITFASSLSYLSSITNKDAKYCYAEYDNKEVIELCQKFKMHTIIPTIQVKKNPYTEIKDKLTNSAIISIPINNLIIDETKVAIDYLKTKGYTFKTLEDLLSEQIDK